jgi:hypothetical protein
MSRPIRHLTMGDEARAVAMVAESRLLAGVPADVEAFGFLPAEAAGKVSVERRIAADPS